MNLYKVLASEYTDIFPSSPEKVDFVNNLFAKDRQLRILDIGCASGDFIYQLASDERLVWGIDLDEHMIGEAESKLPSGQEDRICFYQADMGDFLKSTEPESFDLITCLGNTIVYLDGEEELRDFLCSACSVLENRGRMLIQILNYRNEIIGPGFDFPLIRSRKIEFRRSYRASEKDSRLNFVTEIKDREKGDVSRDIHKHYPFSSRRIREIARESGFSSIHIYGGYDGKEAENSDFFHLLVLEKELKNG